MLCKDSPSSTHVRQPAKPCKVPTGSDTSKEEESVVGGLCNENIEAQCNVVIRGGANGAQVAGKQVHCLNGIIMTLRLTILSSLASR